MVNKSDIKKEKLLEMFSTMVRIREFEKEALELTKKRMIRAVVHTYIGQEAVATGTCSALATEDSITSTHRGHGHCIAKGAVLWKMYAELLGKETGYCKGKGGSMHIADLDTGNLGANGIVGGSIPIAVGAALGSKLRDEGKVVVCFFGDGASNQGSFHEAINMASIWDLPVIFLCENNKYAISTHYTDSVAVDKISERAKSYAIEGITIDGNDVLEVFDTVSHYVDKVRKGEGPVLIEADTYRMKGHYFGDNQNYRDRSEVKEWKKKDPITNFRLKLINEYDISEDELDEIVKNEKQAIISAVEKAKNEPDPTPEELNQDLWACSTGNIEWKRR
jgi:pyruvate dehydrogenase E1 component alpha subunit